VRAVKTVEEHRSQTDQPCLAVLALFAVEAICVAVNAQPELVWHRTYGGNRWDAGLGVVETGDGGFVVSGITYSFGAGQSDFYILKIDGNGNRIWEKSFGGDGWDEGGHLVQSGDGGFVVGGYTSSFGLGEYDVCLLKIDREGNLVWYKTYGGPNCDYAFSITEGRDGFLVAGETFSFGDPDPDAYFLKVDGEGSKVWERTYGGNRSDCATCVIQTGDGGYLAGGYTSSFGAVDDDAYLLKIDCEGGKVWERTYGGSGHDSVAAIAKARDGHYLVVVRMDTLGDVLVLNIDPEGNVIWNRTYGGSGVDMAGGIAESIDGGFVLAGATNSFGAGSMDVYLLMIDNNGDLIWSKAYGGRGEDSAVGIARIGEGEFVVVGQTDSFGAEDKDVYVLKIRDESLIPIREFGLGFPVLALFFWLFSRIHHTFHCDGSLAICESRL